jgi:hypothetical protein
MRRVFGILAIGVLTASCGPTIRITMLGQPHPPGTAASEILVYSARLPDCPFDEIALVSAARIDGGPGMDVLLAALRQQAHSLGGHAIVGLTERPRTEAEGPSLVGTVIRFTVEECRPGR